MISLQASLLLFHTTILTSICFLFFFENWEMTFFFKNYEIFVAVTVKKARPRFELGISSLLVRRFNQLSHRALEKALF